jgi:hypothetical protein
MDLREMDEDLMEFDKTFDNLRDDDDDDNDMLLDDDVNL